MKKNLLYKIVCLLFSLICCSGHSFIMPLRFYFIVLFGLIQFIKIVKSRKIKIIDKKGVFFLIAYFLYVVFGISYSIDKIETIKYSIVYASIILMIMNSYNDKFDIDCIESIIKICKFISITIILNVIVPNLFTDYFGFLIKGGTSSFARVSREVNKHIFSGIAGEKGEAAYIMVVFVTLLIGKKIKNNNLSTRKDNIWLIIAIIALLLPAKRMLFVIGILIILFYIAFWTKSKNRFKIIIAFIVLGTILGFCAMKVPQLNTLATRFIEKSDDTTGNGRIHLWNIANEMYNNRKILGYGYGSYNKYASKVGVILSKTRQWDAHAHNIYYQLLAETGIIGIALFILIIAKSIKYNSKILFKKINMSNNDKMLHFISFSLIISNIIYGYSGNPIYHTNQVFVLFWGIKISFYLSNKYLKKERSEYYEKNRYNNIP